MLSGAHPDLSLADDCTEYHLALKELQADFDNLCISLNTPRNPDAEDVRCLLRTEWEGGN
jgi:hypothetical protein